jgi:hypothetical protein
MRRFALLLCVSALALASACSDRSTSPTADATARRSLTPVPVCLTATEIDALIDAAFVDGSPDEQAALGKWDNIQKQRAAGDREEVIQEKTIDLVDFMLTKKQQGKLLAEANETTLQAFADLINALFCYANLGQYYFPGGDGWFIYPSDDAQTIEREDGQAAMRLPANAVFSPTLVTITPTSTELNTKLDKYPQNFEFSKYPANEPFAKFVITEVCAATPSPEIFEELVLGHNKADGSFELLPEVPSLLTRCATTQASAPASITDRLLNLVLPRMLHAAVMFGGGGVAGSVLELSPIGPVDPRINVNANVSSTTAPIGSLVAPSPAVTLTTPNGVPLDGIRVDFATLADSYATGATVTPSNRLTMDAAVSNDSAGVASATWRLGTALGTYGLSATPQIGGTVAVPGVEFLPALRTFEATSTPPSQLVVTQSPASGSSFVAGVTHTPATRVEARDASGRLVEGFTGTITMTAASGVTPQAIGGTVSQSASAGVATFDTLFITKTGTFTMAPAGAFGATSLVASGAYDVTITPAAATTITAVNTVPATSAVNTVLTPVVVVRDQYGNLRPGTPVYFTPTPDENNVTPSVATTLSPSGQASTQWTVLFGTNTLFAALDATAQEGRFVEFTTNVATSTSVSLSCSEKGNREPINNFAVRLTKAPAQGSTVRPIKAVQFYFSVNGNAKAPTNYPVSVAATYTTAAGVQTTVTTQEVLALRGSASEDLAGRFTFLTAFTPKSNTPVVFKFTGPAISNEIRFNVGPCQPGDRNCRSKCEAKTISSTGFDLFANPIVRESMKFDLFSN